MRLIQICLSLYHSLENKSSFGDGGCCDSSKALLDILKSMKESLSLVLTLQFEDIQIWVIAIYKKIVSICSRDDKILKLTLSESSSLLFSLFHVKILHLQMNILNIFMFKNVGYRIGSAVSIFGQIDSGGDTKNISSYACLVFFNLFPCLAY